jgi:AcrR family transcriptional regulator
LVDGSTASGTDSLEHVSSSTSPAARSRRSGEEIRKLVLDAARELFAEQGYGGTTTREIAAAAGVSSRLIFSHFENKATLFEQAVVEPITTFINEFAEEWRTYAEEPHHLEYIARRWANGMYDLLRRNRKLVRAMLAAAPYEDDIADIFSGKDSPIAAMHRATEQIMEAEVERWGYTGVDIRLTSRLPFGMLLAAAVFDETVLAGIGRRPSRDAIVDELVALTVFGSSGRSLAGTLPQPAREST